MDLDPWEVVVVPFPFAERRGVKRRPALVVSRPAFGPSGHVHLAMITTRARRPWPGDTELRDPAAAGLPRPSLVRLKLFTLDRRLVLRSLGRLAPVDRRRVSRALARALVHDVPG